MENGKWKMENGKWKIYDQYLSKRQVFVVILSGHVNL
jgi:hypothetical protein